MNFPFDAAASDAVVDEQDVDVAARDGLPLRGTLYTPHASPDARVAVVFNTGGGLAMSRYRHFLRFLAAEGFPLLAYDYRGVGASRPARLRGFEAGLEDWSAYDQAGAIDWMRARYPAAQVCGVSHSIGALVACGAPNAAALARIALVAPHTGYWGDYATAWKAPMTLWWHAAMPAIARVVGYFPGRALHLGDDLPLRFALQWAGRRTPAFRPATRGPYAARAAALLEHLRTLAVAVMAVGISDDGFAGPSGIARFIAAIPRAAVVRSELDAQRLGRGAIGHFGFFSRRHAALWPIVSGFLRSPVPEDVRGAQRPAR